jgi:hypothetical protein
MEIHGGMAQEALLGRSRGKDQNIAAIDVSMHKVLASKVKGS